MCMRMQWRGGVGGSLDKLHKRQGCWTNYRAKPRPRPLRDHRLDFQLLGPAVRKILPRVEVRRAQLLLPSGSTRMQALQVGRSLQGQFAPNPLLQVVRTLVHAPRLLPQPLSSLQIRLGLVRRYLAQVGDSRTCQGVHATSVRHKWCAISAAGCCAQADE